MHFSVVETFLLLFPTGYGKSLCFALLPPIGRMAYPAALDNLRCSLLSLTLLPQQRHTVQAPLSARPCGFDMLTLWLHVIMCYKFPLYMHV